jgi:hypothetical protein
MMTPIDIPTGATLKRAGSWALLALVVLLALVAWALVRGRHASTQVAELQGRIDVATAEAARWHARSDSLETRVLVVDSARVRSDSAARVAIAAWYAKRGVAPPASGPGTPTAPYVPGSLLPPDTGQAGLAAAGDTLAVACTQALRSCDVAIAVRDSLLGSQTERLRLAGSIQSDLAAQVKAEQRQKWGIRIKAGGVGAAIGAGVVLFLTR